MKTRNLDFCLTLLLVCFLDFTAKAQIISGAVTDETTAPVENAKVALYRQKSIVAQTSTDSAGKFTLTVNDQGNLLLRVIAPGFAGFERNISNQNETNLATPLTIVLVPQTVAGAVTVSITRNETRLSETPGSVVVLNRQTIENTGAISIDDALRQVPGFTLFRRTSSRTANPTTQGANLRGIGGSGAARTTILFDDTSLNDAFGGWTYWARIPRAAIEQIEVLRGGASSIYGSGGLSGAINILSKKTDADAPVLQIETSVGTQDTLDNSLFGSIGKNSWTFDLAAETFQTDGYFPVPQNLRGAVDARANSRHQNGFVTVNNQPTENLRLFARAHLFSERRDNGTVLQKNRTYFRQAAGGADFENQALGLFRLRFTIETQIYDQNFTGVSADRNAENLTRVQRVPSSATSINLFWTRPLRTHVLSTSFETKRINGFSDETVFNNNRATAAVGAGGRQTLTGIFAQDFWRISSKLNLNFGARFDFWRDANALSTTRNLTGSQPTTLRLFRAKSEESFSPQLAALYQINSKLAATVSFNRSFRAPTLNELYRAFRVGNILTLANESLTAERAASFEAGLRYAFLADKFNLRTNVFTTSLSRPVVSITLSAAPGLITRQRQNLGETRSNGLEIDFEANLLRRNLTVSVGYLLVDARITDFPANNELIGNFLPQIAKQQFAFQTVYRPEKYSLGLQGRFLSCQFDDDQNQFRLGSLFTLDAFASRRLIKRLDVFAAVENVFNRRYDIALTPTLNVGAPRSVRIGLRFNLGKK